MDAKTLLAWVCGITFLAIHNGYVQRLSLFIHLKVSLAHTLNRLLNPSFNSSTSTLLCNYDYVWFFFLSAFKSTVQLPGTQRGRSDAARTLARYFSIYLIIPYVLYRVFPTSSSLFFFYSAYLLSMSVYFALIQTTELELHFFFFFCFVIYPILININEFSYMERRGF